MKGLIKPDKASIDKYLGQGSWLDMSVGELLDRAARERPDKEALADDDNRLTYARLHEQVQKLAIGLMQMGIGKGDSVMVQLPNWNEFAVSYYALHKVGATAVLTLPRHMQVEINYLCGVTGAKAWILPEKYRKTDYLPLIEEVRKANPGLEHIISVRSGNGSRFTPFEKLVAEAELTDENLKRLAANRPDLSEPAFVLATGGTTGLPKAVPRTHYSAVCEARFKHEAREQTEEDICLLAVPMEHNLGLVAMNSVVYGYGKVVFLDSSRIEDVCAAIEKEKITCAPLVPTLLSRLVEYDDIGRHDLSSLKKLYVGGARTSRETIEAVHRRIGPVYTTAFGMSEGATFTTKLSDPPEIIFDSIGKPCSPYDEFRTVGPSGETLPRNQEGELQGRGPTIFNGYLDNPEENRRVFTSDGFFSTGDMAVIDDEGYVRITGRIKDIIIRGGENISPAEIEALVSRHPQVDEVAVIGVPDAVMGERACACVVPKPGVKPTLEDIVAFLRENGASVLQLPERLEIVAEIPLTKIGKPDKKELQKQIMERLGL